ncbi:MAG: PQQ-dependent sugar dehydrogenase [Gemmatimonadota bacterium]|nr:PQQ-dependent sugar dehydrogenase [Gemmatimonadota bacterium]MDH3421616.1 PQQ-dependent sugar dehydrogenase [Gemmatimonadota bacterium]
MLRLPPVRRTRPPSWRPVISARWSLSPSDAPFIATATTASWLRILTEFRQHIRDIRQRPDGLIYVLTDDEGALLRIEPVD